MVGEESTAKFAGGLAMIYCTLLRYINGSAICGVMPPTKIGLECMDLRAGGGRQLKSIGYVHAKHIGAPIPGPCCQAVGGSMSGHAIWNDCDIPSRIIFKDCYLSERIDSNVTRHGNLKFGYSIEPLRYQGIYWHVPWHRWQWRIKISHIITIRSDNTKKWRVIFFWSNPSTTVDQKTYIIRKAKWQQYLKPTEYCLPYWW